MVPSEWSCSDPSEYTVFQSQKIFLYLYKLKNTFLGEIKIGIFFKLYEILTKFCDLIYFDDCIGNIKIYHTTTSFY